MGWIILFLLLIGVYMINRKLATNKSALMSWKIVAFAVIGWILVIFGGLGILVEITHERVPETHGIAFGIAVWLVFLGGGVLVLRKASKTKKTAKAYRKYIEMVVNQNVRSIGSIASAVGVSYDVAAKDLQDMINIGYLKDAFINHGNREISLRRQETEVQVQGAAVVQTAARTQAVRCPACGANNVVAIGGTSECEYCGTPIHA